MILSCSGMLDWACLVAARALQGVKREQLHSEKKQWSNKKKVSFKKSSGGPLIVCTMLDNASYRNASHNVQKLSIEQYYTFQYARPTARWVYSSFFSLPLQSFDQWEFPPFRRCPFVSLRGTWGECRSASPRRRPPPVSSSPQPVSSAPPSTEDQGDLRERTRYWNQAAFGTFKNM